MEVDSQSQSLSAYINQYQGHTRFARLLVMADKNPQLRQEALNLCLQYAVAEKKI
jgi:hypothetical protein